MKIHRKWGSCEKRAGQRQQNNVPVVQPENRKGIRSPMETHGESTPGRVGRQDSAAGLRSGVSTGHGAGDREEDI